MGVKANSKPEVLSGATLLAWRERMGYSQRDACEALGCSRGAWGGWETGKQDVPRYIGLACAALALGMKGYGQTEARPIDGKAAKWSGLDPSETE